MSVNQKTYDALVNAFRLQPGNCSAAARFAGVARNTAIRAWKVGYQDRLAISVLLEQERVKAEQARIEAEQLAQVKAQTIRTETEAYALALRGETRDAALEAHEQEGKLVKAARQNVHNLAVVANAAISMAHELVKSAAADLQTPDKLAGMTPIQKATLADKLTSIADRGVKLVQGVLEAERLWRGDPTKVIGIVPMEEMSVEEAARIAREAYEAAQRYERHGLEVIDGGVDSQGATVVSVQAGAK